mgnify:CR=1 FL=1
MREMNGWLRKGGPRERALDIAAVCVTATRFREWYLRLMPFTVGWCPRLPLCQRYALYEDAAPMLFPSAHREMGWLCLRAR